jgi:hypothetical protein
MPSADNIGTSGRCIYGFFYLEAGEKRYFYVGRSKNLPRRMREHQARRRTGHEDKYEFIRSLEARGIGWEHQVIHMLPGTHYAPDAERWHVIRLTREGHLLMNMRHGSVEHRKELAEQVKDRHIRNVADVRKDRERRAFEQSRRLRRRIKRHWIGVIKRTGIPDVVADDVLPPVFKRKLLAQLHASGATNAKVVPGWTPEDFVYLLRRPLSQTRQLRLLRESIERSAPINRPPQFSNSRKVN